MASDASEAGYGVCVRELPRETVWAIGRVSERRRFKRMPGIGARDAFSMLSTQMIPTFLTARNCLLPLLLLLLLVLLLN